MQVQSVHPSMLDAADIAVWRRLLAAQRELSSPYLTPDWAQAVGAFRQDARVVIYRDKGRAVAFLPVQRCESGVAVPMGGAICDYQALIAPRGMQFDFQLATSALKVGRIDFTYGLKESGIGPCLHSEEFGQVARFDGGWENYCAERKLAGSKVVARAQKKLRKLMRDFDNEVEFDAFSDDLDAFDLLIGWKRDQMARTGVADIFEHDWVAGLVRRTFEMSATRSFGGALFVMRVRGRPVAGLFCLQAGATLHAWFTAFDNTYAEYSPGQVLFVEAIRMAAEAGFAEMDLGPGDYAFKRSLANFERSVGSGFVGGANLHVALRGALFQMRALVEHLPVGRAREWPAKAMRRLDMARGLQDPQRAA